MQQVVGETLLIDENALATGVLIVSFEWPLGAQSVPLRATYPDSFPRLRPIVQLEGSPSTFPRRHCGPVCGTLCLLGRDSRQWQNKWTLAQLLDLQLANTLEDSGDEDPQGEPAEYWWNHFGLPGSYFLVDSSWTVGDSPHGMLGLRYKFKKPGNTPEFRAVVMQVHNRAETVIHTWSGAIPPELANDGKDITIPWTYVDKPVLPDGTAQQIQSLMQQLPQPPPAHELSVTAAACPFAVLYHMELDSRTEGLGWLLCFPWGSRKAFRARNKRGNNRKKVNPAVVPTYRAGEGDLGARAPAVHLLRRKKIAVVGLGAVGAPVVLELARNGCSALHLVDHDTVEPGNAIRWPLGASAWGHRKQDRLAAFIRAEYPWTEVFEHHHSIGAVPHDAPAKADNYLFNTILRDIDLVIDGTASFGVSMILSDHCRERSLPLISLYATPPAEGGVVARFSPQSGCPTCLEFAYAARKIERPTGFDDESNLQQPPGCAERTFTGASFDLQELSLQAMRLIVETFTKPDKAQESVVQTLNLVADGRQIPPSWHIHELQKEEECSCSATA